MDQNTKQENFFSKLVKNLKQLVGMGSVKAKMSVANPVISFGMNTLSGEVTIDAQEAVTLKKITFEVIRREKTYKDRQVTKERDFSLAKVTQDNISIKIGQNTVPFSIQATVEKAAEDALKEKGGALGMLGKLGSMVDNTKDEYILMMKGDIEGYSFGISAVVDLQLQK